MRWSGWSTPAARERNGSPSVSGWGSPGWAAPTAAAGSADAVRRTCACARPSPAGTSTEATPTRAWSTRRTPTGCRPVSTTNRRRRCSAPGSSATGRCSARRSRRAGASGSTASGAAPTSPPRSPLAQGLRVHVLTRGESNQRLARELGAASVGAVDRHAAGAARRRDPVRPGRRSGPEWPCRPSTAAARWRWPASGPPTSRPLNYEQTLFSERRLRSVTANTRQDGETFLALAERLGVRATTHTYRHE